jgi:hypothetical protein
LGEYLEAWELPRNEHVEQVEHAELELTAAVARVSGAFVLGTSADSGGSETALRQLRAHVFKAAILAWDLVECSLAGDASRLKRRFEAPNIIRIVDVALAAIESAFPVLHEGARTAAQPYVHALSELRSLRMPGRDEYFPDIAPPSTRHAVARIDLAALKADLGQVLSDAGYPFLSALIASQAGGALLFGSFWLGLELAVAADPDLASFHPFETVPGASSLEWLGPKCVVAITQLHHAFRRTPLIPMWSLPAPAGATSEEPIE